MAGAVFYFDLGSPYAYLAAARIDAVLGEPAEWQPVSLGALFKLAGRSSWSLGDPRRRAEGVAEVERRAREYGLPPVRWPDPWPGNYLTAMRAATYAQRSGRLREFVDSAYAAAFQRGLDLSVSANVLAAAAEAGLDERDVELAVADPAVKLALREATDAAHALGVFGVPTVLVEGELFWGEDQLEAAASRLRSG
ncbi:MAG: 2-hydroxychromene-2-carboxylate isomerase [Solirubrobacteraceae bacterium]